MEDFAWNCKRRDEGIEAIESSITSFSKKMKIDFDFSFQELSLPSLSFELQDHRFFTLSPDKTISPGTGVFLADDLCTGDSTSSRCSNGESSLVVKDDLRFTDLEAKSFETESSNCIDNKFRETTPSSEFYVDSGDMDPKAAVEGKTCRKNFPVVKTEMPTQAEIDEFFAAAEKEEQKRFAEKYNYDIAKDVPLEGGRYQWLCLKP
ncbi:cyclin-dependent kinase inhibitor 7 isoform X2 [Hevea brasiliensis]|uniref:cyclin-dependent kinase inhibitor 7 isoform X2 n=1 Tax=Hevea brasiliensis TaxID=3981 RepID=UPI0025F55FDF|nr:cyclin-dependent kinase inhibitor 7 isoform X2 [Hevea brasiliensis]